MTRTQIKRIEREQNLASSDPMTLAFQIAEQGHENADLRRAAEAAVRAFVLVTRLQMALTTAQLNFRRTHRHCTRYQAKKAGL